VTAARQRTSESVFHLKDFDKAGYDKGGSIIKQILWLMVSGAILRQWWCPNKLRIGIIRLFGGSIGDGTLIRHNVKIHWPWKLTVGNECWIGEDVWILNLEPVTIGNNTCISQGVLLCTGSHDRRSPKFAYDNAPIVVGDGVWVAVRATILRGVTLGDRSVVGAQALVSSDVPAQSMVTAASALRAGG
jgi:putative colanic acid biosynthesis acetyltransferase WcaF